MVIWRLLMEWNQGDNAYFWHKKFTMECWDSVSISLLLKLTLPLVAQKWWKENRFTFWTFFTAIHCEYWCNLVYVMDPKLTMWIVTGVMGICVLILATLYGCLYYHKVYNKSRSQRTGYMMENPESSATEIQSIYKLTPFKFSRATQSVKADVWDN